MLALELPQDANRVFGGMMFSLSVPFCLIYAIHARRHAPDKLAALGALVAAILFTLPYLVMMPQVVYAFFRLVVLGEGKANCE